MARIRSIKPEFWKSQSIAQFDFFTRLLFIGLWSYVDDNGVGIDHHRLVTAELFPLEEDFASVSRQVHEGLASLAAAGRIRRYTVGGKAYLAIVNWSEHQRIDRPNKPRYPEPDDPDAEHTPPTSGNTPPRDSLDEPSRESRATPATGTEEQRNRGTEEQGKKTPSHAQPRQARRNAPPTQRRATRLPDDFTVTDAMKAWAREHAPLAGLVDHDMFVDHWRSQSGQRAVKADWVATWRNWMRRVQENKARTQRPQAQPPTRSTTDDRVAAALEAGARLQAVADAQPKAVSA